VGAVALRLEHFIEFQEERIATQAEELRTQVEELRSKKRQRDEAPHRGGAEEEAEKKGLEQLDDNFDIDIDEMMDEHERQIQQAATKLQKAAHAFNVAGYVNEVRALEALDSLPPMSNRGLQAAHDDGDGGDDDDDDDEMRRPVLRGSCVGRRDDDDDDGSGDERSRGRGGGGSGGDSDDEDAVPSHRSLQAASYRCLGAAATSRTQPPPDAPAARVLPAAAAKAAANAAGQQLAATQQRIAQQHIAQQRRHRQAVLLSAQTALKYAAMVVGGRSGAARAVPCS